MPQSGNINGVLILLPGFGQKAESIFPESKLHNVAYVNDILTIAIAGGRKIYADESIIQKLNAGIKHAQNKYSISSANYIIGGFSAGGTISLRYAEYCYEKVGEAPITPRGVVTVDSPVDLFQMLKYFQREIKRNFSGVGMNEANIVSKIMLDEIGDPINNEDNWARLTPFNVKLDEAGNEQHLLHTAVRCYGDIDVAWMLKNRRRSLYDSNSLDASELIARLILMGNEQAEFVMAKQAGYRSNGLRHPHSWSIVDEVEFMQWALKIFSE
jgi:hypothetical protein